MMRWTSGVTHLDHIHHMISCLKLDGVLFADTRVMGHPWCLIPEFTGNLRRFRNLSTSHALLPIERNVADVGIWALEHRQ